MIRLMQRATRCCKQSKASPATPPTKEEVERARTQILKNIELTLNDSDRVGLTLSEFIGAGDWRLFFLASRSDPKGNA